MRAIAPSCSTNGAPAAHSAMTNPSPVWWGSRPASSQMSRVPTAGTTTKFAPRTARTVRRSRSWSRKARSGVRSPIESMEAIAKAGTLMSISAPSRASIASTPADYASPVAGAQIQPLSEAVLTASARFATPSFPIAAET